MMIARKLQNRIFISLCYVASAFAILVLLILVIHTLKQGLPWLSLDFLSNFQSRIPERSGVKAALVGTFYMTTLTALIAVPLGILGAVYLEEYANTKSRWIRWLQINISNLAGVPSIVYGLLGLTIFVRILNLDGSILAGSATMALLVLPVIIIASQEAIRGVPYTIREAAHALGAQKYQVVFHQVVPAALPGILTGVILSVSRAVGETAPLLVTGALSYVAFVPKSPMDEYTVLPVQIFNWAARPDEAFHGLAAAAIVVLVVILFSMNLVAIVLRERSQRYRK